MTEQNVAGPAIETAEELLAARPLKIETRLVKALGREVHFRELAAGGIDLFLNLDLGKDGKTARFGREEIIQVLQQTLCNAHGKLICDGADGKAKLEAMAWGAVEELFSVAMECIGLTKERIAEKKAA